MGTGQFFYTLDVSYGDGQSINTYYRGPPSPDEGGRHPMYIEDWVDIKAGVEMWISSKTDGSQGMIGKGHE